MKLNPDGTLSVLTGQVDIAGTNIALAQIAATAYGVDIEKVKITTGDTDVAPVTGLSAGSKTIYTVGVAVMQAAQDARRQTLEIAAGELEAAVQDLEIVDGRVVVRGVPDRGITLTPDRQEGQSLHVEGAARCSAPPTRPSRQQAPAFAAQIARIEVDPDTGEVTLHDFVVVQDAGRAINPLGVEGQMQGGAVQSLGIALTEALSYDDKGRLTNPSLLDYRKLTAADLPNIETIIVEVPSPAGPFGARGVGEPPIVPAPAAIANAIEDATGVRLTECPITSERIAMGLGGDAGQRQEERVSGVSDDDQHPVHALLRLLLAADRDHRRRIPKDEGLRARSTRWRRPASPRSKASGRQRCRSRQSAPSQGFGPLEKGQKPPAVHFAQINEKDGFFLTGRAADPAFTWDKLRGKRVLVDHGGQPLAMFKYACHRRGLDYKAIAAVDVPSGKMDARVPQGRRRLHPPAGPGAAAARARRRRPCRRLRRRGDRPRRLLQPRRDARVARH